MEEMKIAKNQDDFDIMNENIPKDKNRKRRKVLYNVEI